MDNARKTPSPSQKRHRRQMWIQVWLPLGLATAAVIALAVFVVIAAGDSSPVVGQAANISLIYMLAPMILLSLVYAFLVGLMIYLVAKLIRKLPSITQPVQAFFTVVDFKTRQVADGAAQPFIKVRSILAAARKMMHRR